MTTPGDVDNGREEDEAVTPRAVMTSPTEKGVGEMRPMESQNTGGLWGWWNGAGSKPEEGSAAAFVQAMTDP